MIRLPDRPWGRMWMVWQCRWLWIKIINVYPGQRTSSQYHQRRGEWHWRLSWRLWRTDLSWCRVIKPNILHRMKAGWYIEIAWGRPDENDIIRLSDDYGRQR
jgi:hypothetical protein